MKRRRTGVWLALLFGTTMARAASFVEVTPGVVELSVQPGRPVRGRLTLTNQSDVKSRIDIEVREGWTERTGLPGIDPAGWLELKRPQRLVLGPGASRSLSYIVTPPAGLSGETMAMVLFSGPTENTGGPLGVRLRHGIPIYIVAAGTERVELVLTAVRSSRPKGAALEFSIAAENRGNVHLRPRGIVQVTDARGAEVLTVPVAYGFPVFPGQSQTYYARHTGNPLPPGLYHARARLSYGEPFTTSRDVEARMDFNVAADGGVTAVEVSRAP